MKLVASFPTYKLVVESITDRQRALWESAFLVDAVEHQITALNRMMANPHFRLVATNSPISFSSTWAAVDDVSLADRPTDVSVYRLPREDAIDVTKNRKYVWLKAGKWRKYPTLKFTIGNCAVSVKDLKQIKLRSFKKGYSPKFS